MCQISLFISVTACIGSVHSCSLSQRLLGILHWTCSSQFGQCVGTVGLPAITSTQRHQELQTVWCGDQVWALTGRLYFPPLCSIGHFFEACRSHRGESDKLRTMHLWCAYHLMRDKNSKTRHFNYQYLVTTTGELQKVWCENTMTMSRCAAFCLSLLKRTSVNPLLRIKSVSRASWLYRIPSRIPCTTEHRPVMCNEVMWGRKRNG